MPVRYTVELRRRGSKLPRKLRYRLTWSEKGLVVDSAGNAKSRLFSLAYNDLDGPSDDWVSLGGFETFGKAREAVEDDLGRDTRDDEWLAEDTPPGG